jgi:hypothetical protein
MTKEITIARIYLSEAEHHGTHKPLMQEILNILRNQQRVRNVTVFRGIAGMVDSGEVHADDILRVMVDLPVVIEFYDEPKVVSAVLDILAGHIEPGRTVLWNAICR